MTSRLEQAINQLTSEQREKLVAIAESLAGENDPRRPDTPTSWKFDWVGSMSGRPEKSGVEA